MYVIPVRIIRCGVNHHNIARSLSYDVLNSAFDVDPALQILFVKNGFLSKGDKNGNETSSYQVRPKNCSTCVMCG